MSLLSRFTKRSALSPVNRLVNNELANLERRFENSVSDLFSEGLSSVGLSSRITEEIGARLGNVINGQLANRYFRTGSAEINRVTGLNILNGVSSRFAETSINSIDRLDNEIEFDNISDVHQFPSQIGKFYVNLKFREYVRTAPQAGAKLNFKNAIVLPIPNNLTEDYNLNISQQATGITGGIADAIQASTSDGGKSFKASSSAGALAYSYLAQNGLPIPVVGSLTKLDENTRDVLGSYIGSVPNPHLATIFNGVNMRPFSFEWTFNPRNPKESRDLEALIEKLKQNSLPAFSTLGTAVLQYPFLCFVELEPWQSEGKPLIEYKPALITNVSVNRSPNGIPSFFEGTNLPTFIQLNIDFLETEYFTANDFGRSGRTAEEGDKLALGFKNLKDIGANILERVGVEDGEAAINNATNSIDDAISTGSSPSSVVRNSDGSIAGGDNG